MTREEFQNSIIAQYDDEDYSESGYVVCVIGDTAMIGHYSHCSCYGTFDDLCGGGIGDSYDSGEPTWAWTGTVPELVRMANEGLDPDMPTRKMGQKDVDYDHLRNAYARVMEWSAENNISPDS